MTSPTSKCNLTWCTSKDNAQTHPNTVTPEEFERAVHRQVITNKMIEAYRLGGLADPTFQHYSAYYQSMGWTPVDLRRAIPQKVVPLASQPSENRRHGFDLPRTPHRKT